MITVRNKKYIIDTLLTNYSFYWAWLIQAHNYHLYLLLFAVWPMAQRAPVVFHLSFYMLFPHVSPIDAWMVLPISALHCTNIEQVGSVYNVM